MPPTPSAETRSAGPAAAVVEPPPRLAEGVELIGEYEGSGFQEPPSLARRGDGQVIQLTPLLYSVAGKCDGSRDLSRIAEEVGHEIGRTVTAANIRVLVDEKLRPLGLLTLPDGAEPPVQKADPLLALKFRAAVVPERATRALATLFKPLFLPPVILAALVGLVLTDAYVFFRHGVAQATRQALYEPAAFLLILGAVVLSAAFHEIGHAAGCRYGGAEPGRMGCGLYLAWPAFYTDVTDAYRLGKLGRLRTDLGGVYFNVLVVLATMGAYLLTRAEPLLLLIVVQHAEIVHQLLPIVRLDGYYIVADLTGVPDLFNRIRPILTSALPWRPTDEKVRVLRPWVRVAVTTWVLIVVPLLLVQLVVILVQLPRILGTALDSLGKLSGDVNRAFGGGDALGAVGGIVQILALTLPIVAILLMLARLAQRTALGVWRRTQGRPVARFLALALGGGLALALAYVWIPKGDYTPIRPDERGTVQEGVRAVNPVNIRHLARKPAPAGLIPSATTTTVPPAATAPATTRPRSATSTSRPSVSTTARLTPSTTTAPATTTPSEGGK